MPRIKIISNPYKKEIKYQRWNSEEEAWVDIVYESNRNSKLLNGDLIGSFFPFKAKEIVDLLNEEYGIAGETLEIAFEGTTDEYNELEEVCNEECFINSIRLSRSKSVLENARDILPEIRQLFQRINPLIAQSVDVNTIQYELNRFSDASNDRVPICVIGNYSVGKSTIINALIGSEILPYGDEPVTAKIYKISRSEYLDRASIQFQYKDIDIRIQFTDTETKIDIGQYEEDLIRDIIGLMKNPSVEDIAHRVNKVLTLLNNYETNEINPGISDLIEINIAFKNGVLAKSRYPFVIFDTPGANSFSNERHLKILKEAMTNMTSGLPIVLSTSKSLDSTDNENLCRIIRDIDELDTRFTMIILNQYEPIDANSLDATIETQKRILDQALPRNLYSGGLFYLSPIIGLGYKTHGTFADDNYKTIYDAFVKFYEDPENEKYRRLYLSNIQPIQLKRKAELLASAQNNVVYANSGLYTVEAEIENFLSKYSGYDKCIQSKKFLQEIIRITKETVKDKKEEFERLRANVKEQMDASEKKLRNNIEDKALKLNNTYTLKYPEYMKQVRDTSDEMISETNLRNQKDLFLQETEEGSGETKSLPEEKIEAVVEKKKRGRIPRLLDKISLPDVKVTWGYLNNDKKATEEEKNQNGCMIEEQADKKIVEYINGRYAVRMKEIYDALESNSKGYWTEKSEQLRQELIKVVNNSGGLTEFRKKEVEKIIITYEKLSFKEGVSTSTFNESDLKWRFSIHNFTILESKYINLKKTNKKYHDKLKNRENELYESIKKSHHNSVDEWIQSLQAEINENIFEYSLKLSQYKEQYDSLTKQIVELEERQKQMQLYTDQLSKMMDWRSAG